MAVTSTKNIVCPVCGTYRARRVMHARRANLRARIHACMHVTQVPPTQQENNSLLLLPFWPILEHPLIRRKSPTRRLWSSTHGISFLPIKTILPALFNPLSRGACKTQEFRLRYSSKAAPLWCCNLFYCGCVCRSSVATCDCGATKRNSVFCLLR